MGYNAFGVRNTPQTDAVRTAVRRGSPLGGDQWQQSIAKRLGLESTLRRQTPKQVARAVKKELRSFPFVTVLPTHVAIVSARYNASIMLWSTLKQQGTSRWVRSSYFWLFFVPIAAHLLSTVSGRSLDVGDQHLSFSIPLPFSWKLFYFGAVAFALAGFLFHLACPPLVRDFNTYSEYVDVGKGSFYIVDSFTTQKLVDHFLTRDLSHSNQLRYFIKAFTTGDKVRGMDFRAIRDDSLAVEDRVIDLTSKVPGEPVEIIPEKFAAAFWYARNAADESRRHLRTFCTLLYAAGYTAFFVVSCQGFWFVLTV